MKKNGFTLVELLAMLVVLGIIMVIAIPNISGMLANQKLDALKNDANSMVESAKMKVNKDRLMVKPSEGECIGLSLNYLDDTDSIAKGPNGGNYDKFDSIVIYTRKNNKYLYYVRLVEEYNGKRTGIHLSVSGYFFNNTSKSFSISFEPINEFKMFSSTFMASTFR